SKQAKSEESTRPKSKILELKPFESSIFKNLCCSRSFDVSSPSCSILHDRHVWIIGLHSTALRNCLAIRQLLLFTTDLILSFWAQHTGAKGKDKTLLAICQMGSAILRSSFLHSFSCLCSFLLNSQTQVQPFKKGVSNSATQDSIINVHNKAQFT
ncbi:hypothetical protein H5410_021292, partial [Solanum commersonii]